MLKTEEAVLVLVDIQGKLANLMHDKERLFRNLQVLTRGIRMLDIPVFWMEQNPAGLGPTIPEVADLLPDIEPFAKMSFSGCGNPDFVHALAALDRKKVLIAGIETHICVYQTAADLLDMGYGVEVVTDAVSSRIIENKKIGLQKMQDCGATLTSVETVLFELLKAAGSETFKAINQLVK